MADVKPFFYVKGAAIFQRPVKSKTGVRMGFCVCEVCDGVEPQDVCDILNRGEPATNSENL